MIKKFNEHNDYTDLLLEKMINESVLYFSEVLRDRLTILSGSSEIAKKLLELEGTDVHSDVTFVDLSTTGTCFTCIFFWSCNISAKIFNNTNTTIEEVN